MNPAAQIKTVATLTNSAAIAEDGPLQARRVRKAEPFPRRFFEHGGASNLTRWLIAFAGFAGYVQAGANELLSALVAGCIAVELARRLDQGLPLMQVGAFLAALQWLVGPAIAYNTTDIIDRYFMYVPAEQYFGFALPATAVYVLGLLSFGGSVRQRPIMRRTDASRFVPAGLVLNAIAIGSEFARDHAPAGLAFFFHLLSQLRYVGAIYFLFSNSRWKWPLVAASCSQLFLTSSEAGVFHDLILWAGIIFCYWYALQRHTVRKKVLVLSAAAMTVTSIQLVKQSYREKLRAGLEPDLLTEIVSFWTEKDAVVEGVVTDPWGLAAARLNQGWIISAVMNHVPRHEPFAEGETVVTAVTSSFLPRVVAGGKKQAGGQESFRRFTGLDLHEGTSMGISPLGEAYANFGVELGIAFMGVLGWAFSSFYFRIAQLVKKEPLFLLWLPLVFYQAIKAETELVVVMNQVVKGSVVALAGYFTLRSMFPAVAGRRAPHDAVAAEPALAAGSEG